MESREGSALGAWACRPCPLPTRGFLGFASECLAGARAPNPESGRTSGGAVPGERVGWGERVPPDQAKCAPEPLHLLPGRSLCMKHGPAGGHSLLPLPLSGTPAPFLASVSPPTDGAGQSLLWTQPSGSAAKTPSGGVEGSQQAQPQAGAGGGSWVHRTGRGGPCLSWSGGPGSGSNHCPPQPVLHTAAALERWGPGGPGLPPQFNSWDMRLRRVGTHACTRPPTAVPLEGRLAQTPRRRSEWPCVRAVPPHSLRGRQDVMASWLSPLGLTQTLRARILL